MYNIEFETADKDEIEAIAVPNVRPPRDCGLDETGAGRTAANLIRELDRVLTREQVYAVARWMAFLATQA